MTRLRLAFMGTPEFSVPALLALIAAGHEIACVYSQPPRPAGRGQDIRQTAVHKAAAERGIPVRTPKSLRNAEDQAAFAALGLDTAIVVAYGLILPRPILEAPRLGCLNIHASLLPRWRGAAPIQRAIMAGDAETGVMIMCMDEGLDTGPVLAESRMPLPPDATAGWLHDRLSQAGANLIAPTLDAYAKGTILPRPQAEEGATYARKITREETHLDFTKSARELDRIVRGLSPAPGAWCEIEGLRLKILSAEPGDRQGEPGTTLDDRLTIACAEGALRLTRVQREGKQPMTAEAFLRGTPVPAGSRVR